jgi:hypothetical protein
MYGSLDKSRSRRRPSRARRLAAAAAVGLAAAVAASAGDALAVPPGGPVDHAHGAKVTIGRSTVRAGGRIKVTGRNWVARGSRSGDGAVVTIKLDDRDILAVLPIRGKRFSGWVRIPRQVRTGRHWLRFLAAEPATSVRSKRFKVTR